MSTIKDLFQEADVARMQRSGVRAMIPVLRYATHGLRLLFSRGQLFKLT